jgi:hypothetical protein
MRLRCIDDNDDDSDGFGASADRSGGGVLRPLALMHVPAGKRSIIESAAAAEDALSAPSQWASHSAFIGGADTTCNVQLRVVSGAVQGVSESQLLPNCSRLFSLGYKGFTASIEVTS